MMNCSSYTTIAIRMSRKNKYLLREFKPINYSISQAQKGNSKMRMNILKPIDMYQLLICFNFSTKKDFY